jgi:hypothetical protein
MDEILQDGAGARAVGAVPALRPELGPEELVHVSRGPAQRRGDVANAGDRRLDPVPRTLDRPVHGGHLVPVLGVVHPGNVDDGPAPVRRHGFFLVPVIL